MTSLLEAMNDAWPSSFNMDRIARPRNKITNPSNDWRPDAEITLNGRFLSAQSD